MSNLRDALRKAERERRAQQMARARQAAAAEEPAVEKPPIETSAGEEPAATGSGAEAKRPAQAPVPQPRAAEMRQAKARGRAEERAPSKSRADASAPQPEPVAKPKPKPQLKGLENHRITLPNVPSQFAAEIDVFRQGIEAALPGPKRRILMTSATAGEGVTTLSLFLAISLAARAGRSVCLVDCNLRSSGLTRWLGLEPHLGVSDVCHELADWPDALRPTQIDGLYVVGTGRAGGEPSVLLGGRAGQQMATKLSSRFDYVILDGGRTLGQVEASLLAPSVDGAVLVVRANHTKREVLAKAETTIRLHGGRVVGSILNRRTYPIPDAGYRRL